MSGWRWRLWRSWTGVWTSWRVSKLTRSAASSLSLSSVLMICDQSVSDMAANKFKRMLNKELSVFSESSKSGNQIADHITSTYYGLYHHDIIIKASL